MKNIFFLLGLLCSSLMWAQSDISGFVPVEYENEKLKQVDLIQVQDDSTKVVTSTSIDEKGYFHFRFKSLLFNYQRVISYNHAINIYYDFNISTETK